MDAETGSALVEESAKRSGLIWVRRQGSTSQPQPVWHVWSDGAAYVVTGGIEQPLPDGLADGEVAEVTVPSKDTRGRLVVWPAHVTVVPVGGEQWDAIVPTLQAKRLNAPDGDRAPQRWAQECQVLELRPAGALLEAPDAPSTASNARTPVATPATTPVPRPWHLFGRRDRHPAKP